MSASSPSDSATAWYEEWFNRDEYELVYQNRDAQEAANLMDLLVRVAQPAPEATILDVGCGRGRHALALAKRGYTVTGLDLSPRALAVARKRARAAGLSIVFHEGDMRVPLCNRCFDGVVNLFTAFGYFTDEDDHLRALQSMATALHPGGWLFQDFMNADYVQAHLVPETQRRVDDMLITEQRWIEDGRINKEIILQGPHDAHVFTESVRLLTYDDLRGLYKRSGLRIDATYGDYDGSPYGPVSPRLMLLAHRADDGGIL